MLKLVKCEFLKLKRKKFIPIGVIFSLLFPIALTFIVKGQFVSGEYLSQKDAFDSLFDMVIVYGMQFLLPCMLGILAAFSILLCVFWTSLNTLITAMYDVLPKFVLWILPIPLSMFWSSKELLERGMVLDLSEFQKLNLLPSTLETFAILGVIGIISIFLIDYIYRKRSE